MTLGLPVLLLLLAALVAAEAPQGATPSLGTDHFFADYEFRIDPADLGQAPLQWRLVAWDFQDELAMFYDRFGACIRRCPAPPLNTAYLVLALPDHLHEQIQKECIGLLIGSLFLIAEARLPVDPPEARRLLAAAFQLGGAAAAPGWPLAAAEERLRELSQIAAAAVSPIVPPSGVPAVGCGAAELDVVVAHCDEDLAWLAELRGPPAHIFVYTKCGPATLPPGLRCASVEALPNSAMESMAYATHMHQQYGRFARFTAFVQGRPHEHAPRALFSDALSSMRLGTYDVGFLHLNMRRFLAGTSYCLRDMHERILGEQAPPAFGSYCCSQYIVRRDRLEARPVEVYERALGLLVGKLPMACAQDMGYDARPRIAASALFEHLWHHLLGEEAVLPLRRGDGRLPLFARRDSEAGELPDQLDATRDADKGEQH